MNAARKMLKKKRQTTAFSEFKTKKQAMANKLEHETMVFEEQNFKQSKIDAH